MVFSNSDSPDEWALAIRNYGRLATPGADPFFTQTVRAMLTREDWLNNPTDGFLESFDALVYNQDYDFVPTIVEMVEADDDYALLASTILDSLVQVDRSQGIRYLTEHRRALDGVSTLRADLMARADVRDVAQKSAVLDYLLDPAVDLSEKQTFLGLFPHYSRTVGHRLLSRDATLPIVAAAAIDAAASRLIRELESDGNFTFMSQDLAVAHARIDEYVASATRAGYLPAKATETEQFGHVKQQ